MKNNNSKCDVDTLRKNNYKNIIHATNFFKRHVMCFHPLDLN